MLVAVVGANILHCQGKKFEKHLGWKMKKGNLLERKN